MNMARQMTLATMVEKNARLYSDKVALVCGNTRVTHSELNRQANRLARVLAAKGVARGKRVAILSGNCHRYLEILFATSKLGAVLVTLNWRLKPAELSYIVEESDSVILIYAEDLEEGVRELRGLVNTGVPFVDLASLYGEAGKKEVEDTDLCLEVCDDDVAVQMYTAAVEGRPRGAQLTHGGYAASSVFLTIQWSLTSADANFVAAPLFHVFGLDQTVAILSNGGKTVVVGDYEGAAAAETIEREKVSLFASAGQQLPDLVKELEKNQRDVSSLRILIGDPGSIEALGAIRKRVPQLRFIGGAYGQTECAMMVTMCDLEEAAAKGNRCAGRPVPLMDVRIFDDDDVELPPGEVGEMVVRGPRVMAGYYNLPEVNAQTLRNGWLHTGDLGKRDEDGYFYYVDRKRELIKTGMENVYPEEVERVLAEHPAVKEVAVIGIPDPQWGEAVTAIVALKPEANATGEELIEFCKQQIASYKKPKFVRFVPELPRDRTGQVLRSEVKAQHGYGLIGSD